MSNEEIIQHLNNSSKDTLMENLGIVYTEFTGDTLTAELEVTSKVHQPMGFLHGGVSLAIAETVGSVLSLTTIDPQKYYVFGTQVNGYHLKAVRTGKIKAIASFINKGNSSQVIEINIYNENERETFKNCYVTMINRIVPIKDFD
ncbi:hotdog fold thioesterase [Apibacter raozihei]|uniref:hotdog fold thioesterase n=1 Tax=Apibacter TaxID=1778601 RepID=UPI000FE43165|nr:MULTISPECIES: hotdog fold thioesterase [Apibacter]